MEYTQLQYGLVNLPKKQIPKYEVETQIQL